MNDKKIKELKNLIETAEIALQQAREIMSQLTGEEVAGGELLGRVKILRQQSVGEEKIIEGVFDGQEMVGPDGKKYSIPVNYASKSKLVEGDLLKLTILANGTFVYKQIGPQDRDRLKGTVVHDNETGDFRVMTEDGRSYKLLTAAVTYFKAEAGDRVVVLVPKGGESIWAAFENLIDANDKKDEIRDGFSDLGEDDVMLSEL